MERVTLIHADCREAMRTLAQEGVRVDAVVCDPPYGLGFMGKRWDAPENVAFHPETWARALELLKPGGHLVAFGGTRTYHRMVCAIEDAGFEVRDQLAWVYGSGFPKSHDVSKAIAALETTGGSAPRNLRQQRQGNDYAPTGQANYRKGRAFSAEIEQDNRATPLTPAAREWQGWGSALKPAWEPICLARKPLEGTLAANTLKHGVGGLNIDACRVRSKDVLPRMSGKAIMGGTSDGWNSPWKNTAEGIARRQAAADAAIEKANRLGRWPANLVHDGSPEVLAGFNGTVSDDILDATAARFFYTVKADAADRLGSKHPTVKPVNLMAWLCRLVTPPGGLILDPFAGSGTTGMAALRDGFRAILIEREAEYVSDIRRRLAHVRGEDAPLFGSVS